MRLVIPGFEDLLTLELAAANTLNEFFVEELFVRTKVIMFYAYPSHYPILGPSTTKRSTQYSIGVVGRDEELSSENPQKGLVFTKEEITTFELPNDLSGQIVAKYLAYRIAQAMIPSGWYWADQTHALQKTKSSLLDEKGFVTLERR